MNAPAPVNIRPWTLREAALLHFVPTVVDGAAPDPADPRPWHKIAKCVVIFDANGQPVSGVKNAEWLFHVDQCHDGLRDALAALVRDFRQAATLAGYSADVVEDVLTGPIDALRRAGVTVTP